MVTRATPFRSAMTAAALAAAWALTGWIPAAAADGASVAVAQVKVQTETIRPPASPGAPTATPTVSDKPDAEAPAAKADEDDDGDIEVVRDPGKLPPAVAQTRDKLLAAARSGDVNMLAAIIKSSTPTPVFTFSDESDPAAYWKDNYPDSEGIEVLSILVSVLEAGYVHVDQGTPQEMFVWPYFARMSLRKLSPEQKVELFRIVTGADYRDMLDFGAYIFYRVGIAPDGAWHFFVAGD